MRREHDFTGDYVIQNAKTMREQYIIITTNCPGLEDEEVVAQTIPFRFLIPGPPSLRTGATQEPPRSKAGKNLNRHLPVSTA